MSYDGTNLLAFVELRSMMYEVQVLELLKFFIFVIFVNIDFLLGRNLL